jgi:hypothetical protein
VAPSPICCLAAREEVLENLGVSFNSSYSFDFDGGTRYRLNSSYLETWRGSGNDDESKTPTSLPASSLEPHYSVQVLAELWRLDESTIRRIFEAAPGVLRLGNDERRSGKREYITLRIPASVAEREYQRRIVASGNKDRG